MPKSKRRKVSSPNLERKKSEDQLARFPFAQLPEEDLDYANAIPQIQKRPEAAIDLKPSSAYKKVVEKRKALQERKPEPFKVDNFEIKVLSSDCYVDKKPKQAVLENSAAAYWDDGKLLVGNSGWSSSSDD